MPPGRCRVQRRPRAMVPLGRRFRYPAMRQPYAAVLLRNSRMRTLFRMATPLRGPAWGRPPRRLPIRMMESLACWSVRFVVMLRPHHPAQCGFLRRLSRSAGYAVRDSIECDGSAMRTRNGDAQQPMIASDCSTT